jgi:hypothetical protein
MSKKTLTIAIIILSFSTLCFAEENKDSQQSFEKLKSGIPSIKFDQQTINALQSQTNSNFSKIPGSEESQEQAQESFSLGANQDNQAANNILPGVDTSNLDPQTRAAVEEAMSGVYGQAIKGQTNFGLGNFSPENADINAADIQAQIDKAYKDALEQAGQ